jgi:hypothetical protein
VRGGEVYGQSVVTTSSSSGLATISHGLVGLPTHVVVNVRGNSGYGVSVVDIDSSTPWAINIYLFEPDGTPVADADYTIDFSANL